MISYENDLSNDVIKCPKKSKISVCISYLAFFVFVEMVHTAWVVINHMCLCKLLLKLYLHIRYFITDDIFITYFEIEPQKSS